VVNIPLALGSGDEVLPIVMEGIRRQFLEGGWQYCVLVAGTDAIVGDPLGGLNFSISGWRALTLFVMRCCRSVGCKLLILGSGGYVDVTTARCWAALVLDADREFSSKPSHVPPHPLPTVLGVSDLPPLPSEVPISLEYFGRYGPSFSMTATPASKVPRPTKS
jgi:acetoin utilization deacetylase AcuC-like enzyme